MGEIGEELRTARELRGLSLHEAEEATKIRIKYLAALESEEFHIIPGRVYTIGFLRTYAKFLGIDAEELVSRFKENYKETSEEIISTEEFTENRINITAKTKKPTKFLLIFLCGAIALIIIALYILGLNKEAASVNSDPVGSESQIHNSNKGNYPNDSLQTNQDLSEDQNNQLSLTISIKEDSCWLDVDIDGNQDFMGTLNAGESRTFTGNTNIVVQYGNAGTAETTFKGVTTMAGKKGQVVTKEYTINN